MPDEALLSDQGRSTGGRLIDQRRVSIVAIVASCCLVLLDLWSNRDLFDPEGITYLDMADAYRRGDWPATVIGMWSPLYPFLLSLVLRVFGPTARWEFTALHLGNFLIFLATLTAFRFFLGEFLASRKEGNPDRRLPDCLWVVFGYALFTWSIVQLIPLHLPEPDLVVCALVYLIFGILIRISQRIMTWRESIVFGFILGLGYLAKGIMFPMAFVFTGVAIVASRRSMRSLARVGIAFLIFLSVAVPYVIILSQTHGRWTFSDAGRLNHAWEIDQVIRYSHWQGEEGIHGKPLHPTRKLSDDPPLYEFATPFHVTYPPWYNPSYWYEGLQLSPNPRRQLSVFARNFTAITGFLANTPGASVQDPPDYYDLFNITGRTIGAFLTLFLVALFLGTGGRATCGRLMQDWHLLFPIAAVLGAYSFLLCNGRYVAAYVVVFWLVLFRSAATPRTAESKSFLTWILLLAALITGAIITLGIGRAVLREARYHLRGGTGAPLLQSGYSNWKVAESLKGAGLRPGDRVGGVGWTYSAYWARMARLHIVAEIPAEGAPAFWGSDETRKSAVMRLFQNEGVKAVVANGVPSGPPPSGWKRVADTDYYVYVFAGSATR